MYELPELEYSYDALGVHISKNIMELHHSKHHQTYVDKLNLALSGHAELTKNTLDELLVGLSDLPAEIQAAVRNHGGGHYNHSLFWKFMTPRGDGEPSGELSSALEQRYGSFQAFVDEFEAKALGVFGSGWVWLQPDLSIVTTPNQDTPIMNGMNSPILGLDVWEHAYYLDYTYKRADYVKAWWNVVDWQFVGKLHQDSK